MHFTHSKQTITSCVKVSSSSLMSELLFPGNNTDSWAVHLDSHEFQLLCSQESRAEVTQYTKCNLARVPSHAVMIRPDTNHHVIFGLLDKAQVGKSKCHFSGSFENRVVLGCMTFWFASFRISLELMLPQASRCLTPNPMRDPTWFSRIQLSL